MPRNIVNPSTRPEFSIADLMKNVEEKMEGSGVYANHIQIVMTANELTMDLYCISPRHN